ncbi:hypothetical protein N2152v2_011070 [Parachlorella kessleri]
MVYHEEAAAGVVAGLFFLGFVCSVASKIRTGFRLYLLLGVSTLFRGIGFAVRAAEFHDPYNTNLAAVTLVFRQAGFGISIAVLCILTGCWLKNADQRGKPPKSFPQLSIGVRLLIAPVIVFGPILGAVAAGLLFGVGSDQAITTGNRIRKGSSWAFLGVVTILHATATVAAFFVLRWQWRESKAVASSDGQQDLKGHVRTGGSLQSMRLALAHASRDQHSWVHALQLLCALLQLATIFRVVSIYHPRFADNPDLFYPLQVLPELLYVVVLLWPNLMVRVGMAGNYTSFKECVRAGEKWQGRPGGGAVVVPVGEEEKGSLPGAWVPAKEGGNKVVGRDVEANAA